MIDFLMISAQRTKKDGPVEISPKFVIKKSKDLMIRGKDFYAIWVEERGLWSTDEQDVINIVDRELKNYAEDHKDSYTNGYIVKYMWDADSGSINRWHNYCQKQMRDNYEMLDEKLIFSNDPINKEDYASRRLSYPLEKGDISAYDKIIGTLYSEEERHKIEWAIGAIVTGDSKTIQKFMVFYGSAGTGKSTVLNIIQQLFEGYYSVFSSKALGSASNQFALEAFKGNPLVAIEHDGDLSKIEDNTRINSLVSHEEMTMNEKFKSTYTSRFNAFLLMGTNKPVKITDAKSGLIRRLIDVSPSGNLLSSKEYKKLTKQVKFELGAIAYHCKEVYLEDPGAYDNYIPTMMISVTNDFYNFVDYNYHIFAKDDGIGLKSAWALYKEYCEDARVPYPFSQRLFKEEFRNYFKGYDEFYDDGNGNILKSYFHGFITDKFITKKKEIKEEYEEVNLINFDCTESIFDKVCSDFPAQYASNEGTPMKKWYNVKTKLSDLDTSKLHYVKFPEEAASHITVDFDIPDENGNKSLELNLAAASKWPPTYAELSKSGEGIHLHYIYTGDTSKLSRVYGDHIEIKVFTGNSSLRRKLTKCNNLPIATISSGLPLKGDGKVINFDSVKNEKHLRAMIKKNLNKDIHPGTKPSVDFIYKILEDAFNSGMNYDVTDMRNAVFGFAANSTNHADYCIKLVNKMKFRSEEYSDAVINEDSDLVFYDVEVFPNLFVVCWKVDGSNNVVRMINPKPHAIEELMQFRLVGFNCRKYDNHILYAAMMGYSNEALYNLSQSIIEEKQGFFGEAYNISYTDIYDFAAKKQSLKKWEIELGIHHQELGLPWDQPVPEHLWDKVAEYCDNDVIATEATFHHLKGDFTARQILADLAGMTVNDTTNSLTTRIIFGKEKHPQSKFNYRNMGEESDNDYSPEGFDEYTRFNEKGQPVFPGYTYDKFKNKSSYRGEDPSEGGYVYAEPGMYGALALLDIASLHPTSAIQEEHFGLYTQRFADIKQARVYIKHKDFESARTMLDGALAPYLDDESTAKDLAQALKIAINSVYGLTSARFENPFKDPRNIDNIVAKRGALFMINLKHEVQKRGFTVVHVKTDSIKVADATLEIIQFIIGYGKMYGYDFEHEATYDRMCLINDAVYIAKYASLKKCYDLYGEEYVNKDKDTLKKNKENPGGWTATGAQFAVPYVFKTLFTKESITFEDMCETKSVQKGALYLDMNESLPDVSELEKERDKLRKKISDPKLIDQPMIEECKRVEELTQEIEKCHNYVFVGRVGQFTPMKLGTGGGVLYRYHEGKYNAATGTKGYRWLESEAVRTLGKEDDIDRSYYDKLVNDAADNISFFGDLEWFVSDDPYIGPPYDKQGRPVYLDFGSVNSRN